MCGATLFFAIFVISFIGLSPRVWGNPNPSTFSTFGQRSIPTCVGQPYSLSSLAIYVAVYPHVCGATSYMYIYIHACMGLSPRVWGNLTHP